MRREDKEIKNKEKIRSILDRASVCRLGLSVKDKPYIVPMNFGYDKENDFLYFHSARKGKKLDMIKQNNKTCFEIDIDKKLVEDENPCEWGMKYKSVIGFGESNIIEKPEEKTKAIKLIMNNYTDKDLDFPKSAVKNIAIIRLDIKEISGKSGYR